MTEIMATVPCWLVKVEDYEGDPLGRYFKVRLSGPDEAVTKVLEQVPEKMGHPVHNLTESDVDGMEPGEVVLQ
jgi:hypothetical protein